jgi:twinkle protein
LANAAKGAAFLDAQRDTLPTTITSKAVRDDLRRVYREGLGRGDQAGWISVDKLISIAPGQVTTVTGWPNSGKSQFLDALALNLARQGWRFVFCSLENIPVFLHVEKLAKQFIGKPMRPGPTERMSEAEMEEATIEMDEWFSFVMPSEKKPNPGVLDVVQTIEEDFKRRGLWDDRDGKRACVIDPWNELEHVRPYGLSLTEYVGESLSMLRQWARRHMLHVFIVGHPAKQPRNRETGKLPIPTPDMISDSAHFWNKSDNCIAVALVDEHRSHEVDIHIQKVRFSHIGMRGSATLHYDRLTGRYHEPPPKQFAQVVG